MNLLLYCELARRTQEKIYVCNVVVLRLFPNVKCELDVRTTRFARAPHFNWTKHSQKKRASLWTCLCTVNSPVGRRIKFMCVTLWCYDRFRMWNVKLIIGQGNHLNTSLDLVSYWIQFWYHFGNILDPCWYQFGSILVSFWIHFGIMLDPFWYHFGLILV